MERRATRVGIASMVAVAMWVMSTPAFADDGPGQVDRTAALVADVAPDQGELVIGEVFDGVGVVAETDTTTVLVPEDPSVPMMIDGGDEQPVPLVVSLPPELDLGLGPVAGDGTVVFSGANGSAAVQVLEGGATRVQTIISGADDPSAFTYTFGDGIIPVEIEGGVELAAMVGDAVFSSGVVGEAWAVDAAGAPVSTWYEIAGSSLVQHVAADETTVFPVVADPLLTFGLGVYMNLTGLNWKVVAGAVVGATVGVATAACLGAKLPAALAKAIGSACTLIGVSRGINAFVSGLRSVRNMNLTATACYQIKLGSWSGGGLTKVDAKNCA